MLANTYHLMLRPGAEAVAELGGLHRFCGWDGHMLTDSGGYQVFSLDPVLSDEGAEFRSTYDGSAHLLTPEAAVHLQELLGADIQMVLDVCAAAALESRGAARSGGAHARWAERARVAHRRRARSGAVRHRAGRNRPRPAGGVRGPHRRAGLRRLRDRRAVGGRDPHRDAAGARRRARRSCPRTSRAT